MEVCGHFRGGLPRRKGSGHGLKATWLGRCGSDSGEGAQEGEKRLSGQPGTWGRSRGPEQVPGLVWG